MPGIELLSRAKGWHEAKRDGIMEKQWTELPDYRVNRHPLYAQRATNTVARIAKRKLSFTDGDALASLAKLLPRSSDRAAELDFLKLRRA